MRDRKIHWRCFFCDATFSKEQRRWAAEHFGDFDAKPVCLIRSAGESALLSALRAAEKELRSYRSEDSLIMRSMWAMQSDHIRALRQEEELGYSRGLRDARAEAATVVPE